MKRLHLIPNPAGLALAVMAVLPLGAPAADDLAPLSDEFDDAATVSDFYRLFTVEGWPADQLQTHDINTTSAGRMVMIPHASSWYQDYKGPLAFKSVSGDFVVTVDIEVSNRDGTGAPGSNYAFAGILVRAARPGVTSPAEWSSGGENWVVQGVGAAGSPGTASYEQKTTTDSVTSPTFPPGSGRAALQIARIGESIIMLRRPEGGSWSVVQRYGRPDLPTSLQVGLTAYGNFSAASSVTPFQHNQTVLSGSDAGLAARFDYYRLQRPQVPDNLEGLDFANPAQVSNAQLLSFLADHANPAPGDDPTPTPPSITSQPQSQTVIEDHNATFSVTATGTAPLSYQWRRDGSDIAGATGSSYTLNNAATGDSGAVFSVVVSNEAGPVTSAGATLTVNSAPPPGSDDLAPLSDEFDDPSTLSNWRRIFQVEGWGANHLETYDIGSSRSDHLTLVPYSSTWYRDYRATLAFKEISGDFVATVEVEATGRDGSGPPASTFSLAGIMVRTPRPDVISPGTWSAGGENYVFLSLGAGNPGGSFQYEVKTTMNSDSNLALSPGGQRATIQVARIGPHFILLRRNQGGDWIVHRRYTRNDMPETLQVGMTVYTDWPTASSLAPLQHNQTVQTGGNPDLRAAFDFFRYRRPQVPDGLSGANFSNSSAVTDAQLLSFLADNANQPPDDDPPPTPPSITSQPQSQTVTEGADVTFSVTASGTEPLSYQWQRDGSDITGANAASLALDNVQTSQAGEYTVVVSNAAGSVASAGATLTVDSAPPPSPPGGFPNLPQTPGELLTPLLAPQQGRTAVLGWHNGWLYSVPEQPSSQPDSDFQVRRWDISDLSDVREVEQLGITPHPVMAHGYLKMGANLVLGANSPPEAPWSFRAVSPGVNQRTTTPGLEGVFTRGHLFQPWGIVPTYWSYDSNTIEGDATLTYDGETLATFDHLGLSGGVIGHPFIVGNLLIYASDQSRTGVATYDISDPTQPVLLDVLKTGGPGGYWPELWGGDGKLYVVFPYRTGGNGMRVVDVTDPANLRFVADEPLPGAQSMYIQFQDEYAFMGSHKVDMRTFESVLRLDAEGQGVDTSQFLLPLGNLLVTGGVGPNQGMAIWAHQAEPDTRGPSVGYHIPRAGQTHYPLRAPISLLIHETLRSETIDFGNNLIVRPLGGEPISARWVLAFDDILTISPDALLQANTTYEVVVVGGGIKDAAGNGIEPYSFIFSTGDGVNGNQPPSFDSFTASAYPAAPQQSVTLSAAAGDPDDDAIEYRFDFGDGSPRTAWSTDTSIEHAYAETGHYPARVQARDSAGAIATRFLTVTVLDEDNAGLGARRSTPIALHDSTRRVWVVNPDNDTVQTIHADTLATGTEVSVGADPRSVAFDAAGNAWVTCHDADRIDAVSAGGSVQSVNLAYGSAPFGIVTSNDGTTAWVAMHGSGELVRFDTATRSITATLDLGPTPRALAISADGSRLYVSRFISPKDHAEVWEVDPNAMTLLRTFRLHKYGGDQHRDTTAEGMGVANQLAGLALSRDGTRLLVAANKMNTDKGTATGADLDDDNTVRNLIVFLDVATGEEVRTIDVDNSDSTSAIALSPQGDYFLAALQGNNDLAIFDALTAEEVAGLGGFVTRRGVGSAPQGICVDPVTRRAFAKNLMSRDVTVLDLDSFLRTGALTLPASHVSTVSSERMTEVVRRGKEVFHHAGDPRMSAEGYLSCATCHNDGGHDGRVWDFTGRGEGLRNTITLRGRAGTSHGNVHWSANFDEIQDFEHDIRNAFGGTGFLTDAQFASASTPLGSPKAGLSADLDALAAYLGSLGNESIPRSPHRAPDGSLTTDAESGAAVFAALNCAGCHGGGTLTDAALHDVGTIRTTSGNRLNEPLTGIETPTLRGLWNTAPYFHDASANTLEDVFTVAGGSLYPAEDAALTGGAGVASGQNVVLNFDETAFGGALAFWSSPGSATFVNVDGGSGGTGAVEWRYSRSYAAGPLTLVVNGVSRQLDAPRPDNVPEWRHTKFRRLRFENIQLDPGPSNTLTIEFNAEGSLSVDHLIVSTPDDLAAAQPHRQVLSLPQADRANLLAYLRQLDGSPLDNGPAAPPAASVSPPPAFANGEVIQDGTVPFRLSFNRPVTGLAADDLIIGGTAEPGTAQLIELNPGVSYRVEVSGMTQAGTVSFALAAGAVVDDSGQTNEALAPVAINWAPFVDDLAPLSDEFNNALTLASFQRLFQLEGWGANADKLDVLDIDTTAPGRMAMVPFTSSWYQDYVGELTFKEVSGDFVVTTEVIPRNRAQSGPPQSQYSLAGIMVRAPSGLNIGLDGWQTGQQDYVFLSMGAGNNAGTYQLEVKTTDDSVSTLNLSETAVAQAEIQVARLGNALLMLRRDQGGEWRVHRRYHRGDFPETLQVGLTVYTDWNGVQAVYPFGQEAQHNASRITGQNPDLHAQFEYLRFHRPLIPGDLAGLDFTDPGAVSDEQILSFLGTHGNPAPPTPPSITSQPQSHRVLVGTDLTLSVTIDGTPTPALQWQKNGLELPGETGAALTLDNLEPTDAGAYRVIVSNDAGTVISQAAAVTVFVSRFMPPAAVDTAEVKDEGFPLEIIAGKGRTFTIEWSTNLKDWTVLTTFTGAGEARAFLDTAAANQTRRFYRVAKQ